MPADLSLLIGAAQASSHPSCWVQHLFLRERAIRSTRPVPPGCQAGTSFCPKLIGRSITTRFPCTEKIRISLAEYGVPYDRHRSICETCRYQNISREFLKVNPAATVPVLLHNGHPIYESHEQLRYVASRVDEAGLLVPKDIQLRHVMDAWVQKTSLLGDDPTDSPENCGQCRADRPFHLVSMVAKILQSGRSLRTCSFTQSSNGQPLRLQWLGCKKSLSPVSIAGILDRSARAMALHLDDLEAQLESCGGPWICGDQFTLADVGMMAIFDRHEKVIGLITVDRAISCRGIYRAESCSRGRYQEGCANFAHSLVTEATVELTALKQNGGWPSESPR